MKILKWSIITIILVLSVAISYNSKPTVTPELSSYGRALGISQVWDKDTIKSLKLFVENAVNLDAFMATYHDSIIFESGEISQLINLHSLRKPLISLLFGIARDKGLLDLSLTIKDLDITEYNIEFSPVEQSATIRDLLMSRSGIYIQADAETEYSRSNRPNRGQYKPGEFYFYNNFDFNVLGTILKKTTGMSYEECLYEWLAKPLHMQDFQMRHVVYGSPYTLNKSHHKAYKTWMSARDLAKIGAMLAQKGIWKDQRIVSTSWIVESTTAHHFFENDQNWPRDAYAMLWAVDTKNNNIWGTGYGGQFLMIDTTNRISITQRHYTGNSNLSQGMYLMKNTQSSPIDLMNVWYTLLRNLPGH